MQILEFSVNIDGIIAIGSFAYELILAMNVMFLEEGDVAYSLYTHLW